MSNYTRDDLLQLVRNSDELKEIGATEDSIRAGINQLMSTFIDMYGLDITNEIPNNKDIGAPRHFYKVAEIKICLEKYLKRVKGDKRTIRRVIAEEVLDIINFREMFK